MPDNGNTTEQSMEETLKTLERQLAGEDEPDDPAAPSAEILKLPDAAADGRKGRAQNRAKPSAAQQPSNTAEVPDPGREGPVPSDQKALQSGASEGLAAVRSLELPTGVSETLEDLVRELVKPMLQSHLDAKLGEIINRLVQAELNKALEEVSTS